MNKRNLEINNITQYLKTNKIEKPKVLKELLEQDDLYSRNNKIGHITSSIFILSPDYKSVLLILHKKYNTLLAPGGHVDYGEYSLQAGIRETFEEVGIDDLELIENNIFDIDIHRVKQAMKNGCIEPEHWHCDIRYLMRAKSFDVDLNLNEANGYEWIELTAFNNVKDLSMRRMANKVNKINNLKHNVSHKSLVRL